MAFGEQIDFLEVMGFACEVAGPEPEPVQGAEPDDAPPRVARDQVDQRALALDPDLELWTIRARRQQPKTEDQCKRIAFEDPSPCPFVSCRWHIYSDELAADDDGTAAVPERMRLFEKMVDDLPPERWGETCAMRIAKRVHVVKTKDGKDASHSIDGESLGTVPPRYDESTGTWKDPAPRLREPTILQPATIGRYLGCSRESARKLWHSAAARYRGDEVMVQEAEDRHLGGRTPIDWDGDGDSDG